MSTIVFKQKSIGIAAGMRWSVLKSSEKKSSKEIRSIAKAVSASHYVIDKDDESDRKYIGLHTSVIGVQKGNSKVNQIHSLALIFIDALMSASSLQREMINAMLLIRPDSDDLSDLRAVVVIEAGKIIHDSLESRGRANEILSEYEKRGGFQIFSDSEISEGVTVIDWFQIFENSSKKTLANKVPRDPILYVFAAAAVLAVAGQGAYYYFVTIPAKKAEEARKRAEADKTPVYLKKLREEMRQVGWERESLLQFIDGLYSQTAFEKGWGLKTLECDVSICTETWSRHGGIVNDLIAMRPKSDYMPKDSIPDKVAVFKTLVNGKHGSITEEDIVRSGVEAHKLMKPSLNTLINAGANAQWGETTSWPQMPMTGVRPDVIVKRTRYEISSKFPYATEIINQLPKNFIPEKISIGFEQDMNVTIKGFVYEK